MACRCFFTHSFTLPDGLGDGDGTSAEPPPPPVIARMIVLMVIPSAVRIDAMVIPCSQKRVRSRSRSVWSPMSNHRNVSRIRLTCDRRAALFEETASSCLSLLPSSWLIRSWTSNRRFSFWLYGQRTYCLSYDLITLARNHYQCITYSIKRSGWTGKYRVVLFIPVTTYFTLILYYSNIKSTLTRQ